LIPDPDPVDQLSDHEDEGHDEFVAPELDIDVTTD
jgi:hypothetical protein